MGSCEVFDVDVTGSDGEQDFDSTFDGQSGDRKSHKQEMEKKRRARINDSLGKLKSLVLLALKKDEARYSKLEKADILEMTVKYLQSTHTRDAMGLRPGADAAEGQMRYISGFNQCAQQVVSFLEKQDSLSADTRLRLNSHLANCMQTMHAARTPVPVQLPSPPASALQTSALPTTVSSLMHPALHPMDQRPITLTPPHSPEAMIAMTSQTALHQPIAQRMRHPHMAFSQAAVPVAALGSAASARCSRSPLSSGVGPMRASVVSRPVWRPF